jgi:hypothetical protein
VVYCPGGEFSRGAQFPGHDFGTGKGMKTRITTISCGYWPVEMVVKDNDGKLWKVVGEKPDQRLVPYNRIDARL